MTRRKQMTGLQRAKFFKENGGVCHICGLKIQVGEKWEIEHITPFAISEDDSEDNKAPAHINCHKTKTANDKAIIAKGKRVQAKHTGAWKSRSPMYKTRFKKKLDGSVVDRETGEKI